VALLAAWWTLLQGELLAYLVSQVLLAIVMFHGFCLVHEAGHGNCSRRRSVNTLIGHYASIFCALPFFPWKHMHARHHVWAGNPDKDPTNNSVQRWRSSGRVPWLVRASWRTWIPLAAFTQMLVFWTYPIRLVREDRSAMPQALFSVLFLPAAYGALYFVAPDIFELRHFALGLVIYLFANEPVNVPHHADLLVFSDRLPLWNQWQATRSCYYPLFVSETLVLNFDFHIEHHLFPALPWFRLRRARTLIRAALGDDYNEAIGIRWNLNNRGRDLESVLGVRSDDGAPNRPSTQHDQRPSARR
jgi:acyl-lipid omega-6 desaturase (Delta-12 desaturase)